MGDTKDESQKNGNNASGSNKTLIILGIVVGIVFVAMAAVIIVLLIGRNKTDTAPSPVESPPQQEQQREVLVTEENVEEIVEQMEEQQYVPPGYYTVTQNYEWHFSKGDEASRDAHVENLPENNNAVYFDLFLESDEDNPIYQSPVIPLGAVLEKFKLDKALDAGTYDCIMVYHLIDDNQNTLSTVSMAVTVIIEG